MSNREQYTTCMKPYMTSGGPDRKERFCLGAKICSGRASTEAEARKLCAEAAANPKPPKPKGGRKVCTLQDLDAISTCVVEKIDIASLTPENMHQMFSNAIKVCSGGTTAKKRITSAQASLATMDPQQLKALETIATLSKQFEGKQW